MSLWSRLIDRLTPDWLHRQAAEAEQQLAAADEQLRQVTARDRFINRQAAAHRRDLADNHYADRVKAAYAGKGHA